jgi:hypothetical protein
MVLKIRGRQLGKRAEGACCKARPAATHRRRLELASRTRRSIAPSILLVWYPRSKMLCSCCESNTIALFPAQRAAGRSARRSRGGEADRWMDWQMGVLPTSRRGRF